MYNFVYLLKYFKVENLIESWFESVQLKHIVYLLIELAICVIHPIPGNFSFSWQIFPFSASEPIVVDYPVDIILSLPMFLRVYLLWRAFLLNVNLFSPLLNSLGKLNSVEIDTGFMVKSLVEYYPIQMLLAFNIIMFFSASWCIRLTEG